MPHLGVLEHIKKYIYSQKLLGFILSNDNSDLNQNLKKIDILDFICWISSAWDEVKPITIVESW